MSPRPDRPRALPVAAGLALQESRIIEAIKRVREAEGVDLKAAKDRVDAALQADPALKAIVEELAKARRTSLIQWVILIDVLLIAGVAYWFFK